VTVRRIVSWYKEEIFDQFGCGRRTMTEAKRPPTVWRAFRKVLEFIISVAIVAEGLEKIEEHLPALPSPITMEQGKPTLTGWFYYFMGILIVLCIFLFIFGIIYRRRLALALSEKLAAAGERDGAVQERLQMETELKSAVGERDSALQARDEAVAEKVAAIVKADAASAERDAARSEAGRLRKAFDGTRATSRGIVTRLFPFEERPSFRYAKALIRHWVYENGDTEVLVEYHISAKDRAVHFCEIVISSEPPAGPISFLDEISFRTSAGGDPQEGYEVLYLEGEGTDFQKQVSLFFLPQIDPEEAQPRILTYRYRWPGMMKSLLEGLDQIDLQVASRHPEVGELLVECYFHPNLGKILCKQNHAQIRNARPELIQESKPWQGWRYSLSPAPANHLFELEFSRSLG
jgi:hypothetical protein